MRGFKEQSLKVRTVQGFEGSTATVGMSPLRTMNPRPLVHFVSRPTPAMLIPAYPSPGPFLACSDGRGILLRLRYAFLKGDRHVPPYLDREDDRRGQQQRAHGHVRDG